MKIKIKNNLNILSIKLNLIKTKLNKFIGFFSVFTPKKIHLKRFITASLISTFILVQYGYIYDAYAENESNNYLKWIRCVIRNRPQNEQEIEWLKKDENLSEDDKYCLNNPKFKIIDGSEIRADHAYNTLLYMYKEMYGHPEEFLATSILNDIDKPSTELENSLEKMEKNITGDGTEFDFSNPPSTKSSLRYIFEYYMRPDEDTGLGQPQQSLFHTYFYQQKKENEFHNLINDKFRDITTGILPQFINLFTVISIPNLVNNKPPFDKIYSGGNDGIEFLNELTDILIFNENKDGKDIQLSYLGEIRKADQSCTGDTCKAAKALANSGARLVLDFFLMQKITTSSDLGDIDKLSSNKLLMREYYTSLGGDFLKNKSGFLKFLTNSSIKFEDKDNGSDLTEYFNQIKYYQGQTSNLRKASVYWQYLNFKLGQDLESQKSYNDMSKITRRLPDDSKDISLSEAIVVDNLCNVKNDIANVFSTGNKSDGNNKISWPFFVFDPTESGDYSFNFKAAITAIDKKCYQNKYFNDFKDWKADKDGALYINIKYDSTYIYVPPTQGAKPQKNSSIGFIGTTLNQEGIMTSFTNIASKETKTDPNSSVEKAAIIQAARLLYLSFNRYYEGQDGSWFLFGSENDDYLGYNTILKALNTETSAINTLFGNFVSDYISLHGSAYGEYKDAFDPTESIDFSMFKADGWWKTTRDVIYSPIAFFQTMFCDVSGDGICTNPILSAKKEGLQQMAQAVNKYVQNVTTKIEDISKKVGGITLEDTKDPGKMREYETNLLRLLAYTSILDNAVRSLFAEIIEVSNWVDRTRTFYLVAQIIVDVVMTVASFGGYAAAKLSTTALMKALKASSVFIKTASAGKFLISNPVSRVVWGMLRYFAHPLQQINLARYKIWALFTKQFPELSYLEKGIALAAKRVNKAESTVKSLQGIGKYTQTSFKAWDSVINFRIRWNTFLVNINKGPQRFMQVRQSYKEYGQIKKALAGKEDDFLSKLDNYEKSLKTENPAITDLNGKVLTGDEAKIYANKHRSHIEMENPKKYAEWQKARNKLTAEMEAELGEYAKYTQEWTEAGPLLKSLEGKIDATLSPQEIQQIFNTTDEAIIKSIQDALTQNTDDVFKQQKAISDILDAAPIKPLNSPNMAAQISTKNLERQELKNTIDKLIKEGDTLTGPERGELLLKIKNGFGDDISADLKNVLSKTEETLKSPVRAELKIQNNTLKDDNIKLMDDINKEKNFGNKKIEEYSDLNELKKYRDTLDQNIENKNLVGLLDNYIANTEKIIINNTLLKDTFWFNKITSGISKFKQKFTVARTLSILKSTWDIGRYSIFFLKDAVKDCNGDIIDPAIDSEDGQKQLYPQKINDSLTNIYGDQNPDWITNIQDILKRNSKIRSEMIPNVYQNFLILKEFSRQNMNKELEGYKYTNRLFNVVKANLLQSLNNLNSELYKFKIDLSPCGGSDSASLDGQNLDGCLPYNKSNQQSAFGANLFSGFFNSDWLKAQSNQTLDNAASQLNQGPQRGQQLSHIWGRDDKGNPCLIQIGNLNIGAFNAFAGGVFQEGGAEKIISRVIKIFMIFAASLSVLGIVYAGLLYTYSNGEEENLTKAKDIWFNSIIGLLITMLSYFIVSVIQGILYAF